MPFVIAARESGARRAIKEWPDAHWQAVLDELAVLRRSIVLVGASVPVTNDTGGGTVVDLRGRTDLPTLAALCARARLFIGSDSGALHLAAAVGTPVVGIFGPTDWRRTAPRGVPARIVHVHGGDVSCAPCLRSRCRFADTPTANRRCLTDISPRAVIEAARELLDA